MKLPIILERSPPLSIVLASGRGRRGVRALELELPLAMFLTLILNQAYLSSLELTIVTKLITKNVLVASHRQQSMNNQTFCMEFHAFAHREK